MDTETDTTAARSASSSFTTVVDGGGPEWIPLTANVAELRNRFPARLVPASWPQSRLSRLEVCALLDGGAFRVANAGTQRNIRRGIGKTLDWLGQFPGDSWQERWRASDSETRPGHKWLEGPLGWRQGVGEFRTNDRADLVSGLNMLICADVIRPGFGWLLSRTSRFLADGMIRARDPQGFAQLQSVIDAGATGTIHRDGARGAIIRITEIMAAKGGRIRDITPGDCVELLDQRRIEHGRRGDMRLLFYDLLLSVGDFPADAPATIRAFHGGQGQLTVEEMVRRYDLECGPIRQLIIAYLKERAPALDHGSLRALSATLAGRFWGDLEAHHPGISSLNLDHEVAASWKERLKTRQRRVRDAHGEITEMQVPRSHFKQDMMVVRAFYLDLAHWALEDPGRWASYVAPCPIKETDTSLKKDKARHKAKMDQRTRERLPVLPRLVATADERRRHADALLDAALECAAGEQFTVASETLVRAATPYARSGKVWALEPGTGTRRNLTREENDAFWAWACIEILRATGVRVEELLELTHHSLIEYRLPTSGELVPLLQIAPSKTDTERLILVSPELADVLSAIICRIRTHSGTVPLVPSYDSVERIWRPPMPLLLQHRYAGENRALSGESVRRLLMQTLLATGLTDASQQPLIFTPHDFRRLFITEAILNGLPPHIAQVIAGHRDINTTIGYKAVYPQEAIEAHRAFIGRRRASRPSEEYRAPTEEEWDAFLAHFEKRKVSIGTCGRAFNSSCIHEHACVRCALLRPDPAQRPRLVEIRDNLHARIIEAKREGWLGEVEGLQISLAGAEAKIAQLDRNATTTTALGIPTLGALVVRSTPAKR